MIFFLQKRIKLDIYVYINVPDMARGRRGRVLVGFTTTCAISAYQH